MNLTKVVGIDCPESMVAKRPILVCFLMRILLKLFCSRYFKLISQHPSLPNLDPGEQDDKKCQGNRKTQNNRNYSSLQGNNRKQTDTRKQNGKSWDSSSQGSIWPLSLDLKIPRRQLSFFCMLPSPQLVTRQSVAVMK